MPAQFNSPPSVQSTIGSQLVNQFYQKKALIDAKKEQYFSQLADTVSMPKNMGKTIKRFHYLPMLDDQNINDQGIDAAGVVISMSAYDVTLPALVKTYAVEADATAAAAPAKSVDDRQAPVARGDGDEAAHRFRTRAGVPVRP